MTNGISMMLSDKKSGIVQKENKHTAVKIAAVIVSVTGFLCVALIFGWLFINYLGYSAIGHEVEYQATGKGSAGRAVSSGGMVTFNNSQGGTDQIDGPFPFSRKIRMSTGTFAYMSVQNPGDALSVTCSILIDGEQKTTSSSNAEYGIATCSLYVP